MYIIAAVKTDMAPIFFRLFWDTEHILQIMKNSNGLINHKKFSCPLAKPSNSEIAITSLPLTLCNTTIPLLWRHYIKFYVLVVFIIWHLNRSSSTILNSKNVMSNHRGFLVKLLQNLLKISLIWCHVAYLWQIGYFSGFW